MTTIVWEIPLKTVSEANSSEHWRIKSKRHKQQQFLISCLFRHNAQPIVLPCIVKLSRLSPRLLDDDNLRTAFKWIRDEIADWLILGHLPKLKGRNDSDQRITWQYDQKQQQQQGIRIEIEF